MVYVARMHKQRKVNRASWKPRFTQQRIIRRGTAGVVTALTPTLASIAPTTVTAISPVGTVTCTGTNFVSGVTTATVGGVDHSTTFVSPTSVTFQLDPLAAGSLSVNVRNGNKFSTTPRTLTVT